jgi:hypothetical protein
VGVYSRDMGRGNSREGEGGGARRAARACGGFPRGCAAHRAPDAAQRAADSAWVWTASLDILRLGDAGAAPLPFLALPPARSRAVAPCGCRFGDAGRARTSTQGRARAARAEGAARVQRRTCRCRSRGHAGSTRAGRSGRASAQKQTRGASLPRATTRSARAAPRTAMAERSLCAVSCCCSVEQTVERRSLRPRTARAEHALGAGV